MLTDGLDRKKFAIVGAGMAGLACADALVAQGADVTLFDKGRGAGGRMSTRRIETPFGIASFDHGAQYFTVRDQGFKSEVARLAEQGLAEPWPLADPDAWVGTPGMSAVIKQMALRHNVRFDALVKGLINDHGGWRVLTADNSFGPFDAVVIAVPAEQAASLLALHDLALAGRAMHARSQPCWTAMFAFAERIAIDDDIIRDRGVIAWAARNSAKPKRTGPEAWVVQASPEWSVAHLERDKDSVLAALTNAFARQCRALLPAPIATSVHRWRFSLSAGTDLGALWNRELGLGVCGDWLIGPRVECAWLSGKALAEQVASAAFQKKTASATNLA